MTQCIMGRGARIWRERPIMFDLHHWHQQKCIREIKLKNGLSRDWCPKTFFTFEIANANFAEQQGKDVYSIFSREQLSWVHTWVGPVSCVCASTAAHSFEMGIFTYRKCRENVPQPFFSKTWPHRT